MGARLIEAQPAATIPANDRAGPPEPRSNHRRLSDVAATIVNDLPARPGLTDR
jgi:hypothetical protein